MQKFGLKWLVQFNLHAVGRDLWILELFISQDGKLKFWSGWIIVFILNYYKWQLGLNSKYDFYENRNYE